MTVRIAMWSGPRNISTAMMRAFENRADTTVVDEPFYAYYLQHSGAVHPMSQQVIDSQSTDWETVARDLSTKPCSAGVFYQKHMTHHMLTEIDLSWTRELKNCFLIRDPEYVVNSYSAKMDSVGQDDIGIRRQFELYEEISKISGQVIPVIDAKAFLLDPETGLRQLCEGFDIPFSKQMLEWPRGPRDSDGVWASHWYGAVENSTGFQPYKESAISLSRHQQKIADEAQEYYQKMLTKIREESP